MASPPEFRCQCQLGYYNSTDVRPACNEGDFVPEASQESSEVCISCGKLSCIKECQGDWLQIEWAGARQSRPKWESKASAEGDEEKGWVQAEDRTSGKVYLERASGAAFFNLGQSTGNVESKAMSPEQLESVLREMRAVAQQDSDVEMTRVLGANAEAAKGDGRLDRAWQELRAVRSAKRAEDAHQEKVAPLREQQERQIESGKEAHQAGRYAHRAWREQSWAERERAVASSLLS
jgi:hypothetical protein